MNERIDDMRLPNVESGTGSASSKSNGGIAPQRSGNNMVQQKCLPSSLFLFLSCWQVFSNPRPYITNANIWR